MKAIGNNTRNIKENRKTISEISKDIEDAKKMCNNVEVANTKNIEETFRLKVKET